MGAFDAIDLIAANGLQWPGAADQAPALALVSISPPFLVTTYVVGGGHLRPKTAAGSKPSSC